MRRPQMKQMRRYHRLTLVNRHGSSVAQGDTVGVCRAGASCSRAQAGISSLSLPSLSSSLVSPFARLRPGPRLASVAASTSQREAPVERPFSPCLSSLLGYVEAEKEFPLDASKGNTRAEDRDRAVAIVPGIVGSDLISAALRATPMLWNLASLSTSPTRPWATKGEDSAAVLRAPGAASVGTGRTSGMCVKKEGGDGKRGNEKNQVNDKGVKRTGRDVESRHAPSVPHLEKLVDMAMVYSSCLPPCDSSQGGDGERVKRNAGAKRKQGQGESQDRLKALHDSHPLHGDTHLFSVPGLVQALYALRLVSDEEAKRLALYTALYAYSPEERCDVLQELIDEVLATASSASLSASHLPNPERFSAILELQPQPLSLSSSLSPSLCVRLDACAFPSPVLSGSPLCSSPGLSSRGRSGSKAARETLSIDRGIRLSSQSSASSNAMPSQFPQRWQATEVRMSLLCRSSFRASRRREGGNHGEAEAEAKRAGQTREKTGRRDKGNHPHDLSVNNRKEPNKLEKSHSSCSPRRSLFSSIQVQPDERSGGRLLHGFRGEMEEGKRASRANKHVEAKKGEVTGRRKGVSGGARFGCFPARRGRERGEDEGEREKAGQVNAQH
ncbi:AP2 domain transcription factor AP2V-1 [Toxoplasma gondii TgCatPRC2]|uniref:AP2 domain transcription factor AP2V-1 n=1 Tax=Toxoplasma gondii TgCatPRC2 TaxID=1130821 RepID=A0A151H1R5_TOXGO|nr:AP2 domain transcription factor AP2V-1 [Toxoplasma gondii TgCatPRC2]